MLYLCRIDQPLPIREIKNITSMQNTACSFMQIPIMSISPSLCVKLNITGMQKTYTLTRAKLCTDPYRGYQPLPAREINRNTTSMQNRHTGTRKMIRMVINLQVCSNRVQLMCNQMSISVSYTHLTLPTTAEV